MHLPTRTNKGDNQAINEEDVAVVTGLTVDGVPIYVELSFGDDGAPKLGGLVTVAKRGGHAYAVNGAPKTVADRPFGAPRVVLNGERVRASFHEATNAVRNRCGRWSVVVPIGSVTDSNGDTHEVTGYLAVVIKDRNDSTNATGKKAGSIVGQRMFATEVDAVGWKHLKPELV